MQSLLRILGFVTIFIGILCGIYVISDALGIYAAAKGTNDPYLEQVYVIKLVAGGAIVLASIVSGMLYLSFGIVIELMDSLNQNVMKFINFVESKNKKNPEEDDFSF
jgi:hypothetical protein